MPAQVPSQAGDPVSPSQARGELPKRCLKARLSDEPLEKPNSAATSFCGRPDRSAAEARVSRQSVR